MITQDELRKALAGLDMSKPESIIKHCEECGESSIHIIDEKWEKYICCLHK